MTSPDSSTSRVSTSVLVGIIVVAFLVLLVAGAALRVYLFPSTESLATKYGRLRGDGYANSVNGTAVLARMFQDAGHKVTVATRLSPRVLDAEVMVWAPDDYTPPNDEVRNYFLRWFDYNAGQTLIYIGRDFDAAPQYWQDIHDVTEDLRVARVEREAAFAESGHLTARFQVEDAQDADWFVTDTRSPPVQVKKLAGDWAEGVDAAQTDISLDVRLSVPKAKPESPLEFESLLIGDGESLVTRITRKDGKGEILVVQNGSFLLNYPLVRHEHRKLAGKLIEHCGSPGKVVFLESDATGLSIVEKDVPSQTYAFAVLKVWPINIIMLHAAMLGILYCFARYPIFGRPRGLPSETTADFGTHVTALGELLGKTKNANYAQQRLMHYRQQGQRASGRTHRALPGMKTVPGTKK